MSESLQSVFFEFDVYLDEVWTRSMVVVAGSASIAWTKALRRVDDGEEVRTRAVAR